MGEEGGEGKWKERRGLEVMKDEEKGNKQVHLNESE